RGAAAWNATAVAGEGNVRTVLPFDGRLTLRLPYVVGSTAVLGNAQLAASYQLAKEHDFLPSLGLTARVDLPTAPGARQPLPGVRAVATKKLDFGLLENLHAESELWTDGERLTPCHRAAIGATLKLPQATRLAIDWVSVRGQVNDTPLRQDLAQLSV